MAIKLSTTSNKSTTATVPATVATPAAPEKASKVKVKDVAIPTPKLLPGATAFVAWDPSGGATDPATVVVGKATILSARFVRDQQGGGHFIYQSTDWASEDPSDIVTSLTDAMIALPTKEGRAELLANIAKTCAANVKADAMDSYRKDKVIALINRTKEELTERLPALSAGSLDEAFAALGGNVFEAFRAEGKTLPIEKRREIFMARWTEVLGKKPKTRTNARKEALARIADFRAKNPDVVAAEEAAKAAKDAAATKVAEKVKEVKKTPATPAAPVTVAVAVPTTKTTVKVKKSA